MTPQELEIEERAEKHLSTADLAQSANRPKAGSTVTMPKTAAEEPNAPLFAANDTQEFRSRWEKIQIGFVDEPRKAVEQADELVASAIKRLAEVFASERQKLEAEWDKNDNVSTEDLRVALRRYRSFFDRLLSV
jgi:hypothetical protein